MTHEPNAEIDVVRETVVLITHATHYVGPASIGRLVRDGAHVMAQDLSFADERARRIHHEQPSRYRDRCDRCGFVTGHGRADRRRLGLSAAAAKLRLNWNLTKATDHFFAPSK